MCVAALATLLLFNIYIYENTGHEDGQGKVANMAKAANAARWPYSKDGLARLKLTAGIGVRQLNA